MSRRIANQHAHQRGLVLVSSLLLLLVVTILAYLPALNGGVPRAFLMEKQEITV